MSALAFALVLAAAPESAALPPVSALAVEGDLRVELSVGAGRALDVQGSEVEVTGPSEGRLRLRAPVRARGARPVVRLRVDGPSLAVTLLRGAALHAASGRLEALTLEVRHTARADVAALVVKTLAITASEAGRVRAQGEVVTLSAERTAQVTLVAKPKKLTQDVRDAARLVVEP